jgi:hypothetical protein
LAGTTVGALLTYIVKDKEARKEMEQVIDRAGEKIKTTLRRMAGDDTNNTAGDNSAEAPEEQSTGHETSSD